MRKFFIVAILLMALVAFEYFVANVSAYAFNELTRYQFVNTVMLVSVAFMAADVFAFSTK